jgi:hypothetical protein
MSNETTLVDKEVLVALAMAAEEGPLLHEGTVNNGRSDETGEF